jgi:hypothetical protein
MIKLFTLPGAHNLPIVKCISLSGYHKALTETRQLGIVLDTDAIISLLVDAGLFRPTAIEVAFTITSQPEKFIRLEKEYYVPEMPSL